MNKPKITGTQINYYNICHRKLWLFSHNLSMEHNSEAVEIGTQIHSNTFKRKRKEILLDGIKIDFFDKEKGVIHEIKKSKALNIAHHLQLKYYLFYFKKLGLNFTGSIDYPLLRKTEKIFLNENDCIELENILIKIDKIISQNIPPNVINKKFCKKCSYYELCYV